MKKVLLPTDLTVTSLWPIHQIVEDAGKEKVQVYLVHMLEMPTSISDLLTLKSSKPYSQVPENFKEAYQLLCNRYEGKLDCLRFKFIYGNTLSYLNNFIRSNEIDSVYMLETYRYEQPLPQSVDFISLLKKCGVAMHNVSFSRPMAGDYQILSTLLQSPLKEKASVTEGSYN